MKTKVVAFVLAISNIANAQIINQPVEIIEAPPLSAFSERSGAWPTKEIPEDIFSTDSSTIAERMNTIPGFVARESGSPTYSIRGSGQADRVLRLYNGLPLNMADGVGASDLFLPTETLGRVSVLKGPSSVFYGASAFGGAIDHTTRWFDQRAIRLTGFEEGGKLGTRSALGVLPVRTKNSSSQFSVFHERRPGRFPFQSTTTTQSGTRENNAADLSRLTASSQINIDETLRVTAHAIAAKNVGESAGSLQAPFNNSFDMNGTLASVAVEKSLSATDLLSLRFSDFRIWGLFDRDTPTMSTSYAARHSIEADSRFALSDRTIARFFADVYFDDVSASYLEGKTFTQTNSEVGTSWDYALSSNWSLLPGARYRSESGELLKSLGLLYSDSQSKGWLTYSEGFRAPSLSDRFSNTPFFVGNQGLQAERSASVELGGSTETGKRFGGTLEGFALEGALFATRYSNLIDLTRVGSADSRINRGSARAYGLEGSAGYGVSIWSLTFAYAYLDARSEAPDEPLRLSPKHQAAVIIGHQIGPFIIEAKETVWSEFFDRDTAAGPLRALPAWETLDLTFRTIGFTSWEFRGGVLNLLDEPRELTIGYPEPQKRFFLSAMHFF